MSLTPIRFPDGQEVDARYRMETRPGSVGVSQGIVAAMNYHYYSRVDDLASLAAIIMNSINRDHSLIDGNKRASVIVADDFLRLNGSQLMAPDELLIPFVSPSAIACTRGYCDPLSSMKVSLLELALVVNKELECHWYKDLGIMKVVDFEAKNLPIGTLYIPVVAIPPECETGPYFSGWNPMQLIEEIREWNPYADGLWQKHLEERHE